MLNEISQPQNDKCHVISLLFGIFSIYKYIERAESRFVVARLWRQGTGSDCL